MDVTKLLIAVIIIALFGGITAFVFNMILPVTDTLTITLISGVMALMLLLFLVKTKGLQLLSSVPAFFAVLVLIGLVGTLVGEFSPEFSQYFLSATNFTLQGVFFTIFYIGVGSLIAEKFGLLK